MNRTFAVSQVSFVNKINMPGVHPQTGEVMSIPNWTRDNSIASVLCWLRVQMKGAAKLAQPNDGETY
jgi:ubiquitin-protein ligase